jgi:hypothetical protein
MQFWRKGLSAASKKSLERAYSSAQDTPMIMMTSKIQFWRKGLSSSAASKKSLEIKSLPVCSAFLRQCTSHYCLITLFVTFLFGV